jgi:hypothetical protein
VREYVAATRGARVTQALLAQLLVLTCNIHRDRNSEPLTVDDVLPPLVPPAPAAPTTGADVAQFLAEATTQ